jgi:glutaredoxin
MRSFPEGSVTFTTLMITGIVSGFAAFLFPAPPKKAQDVQWVVFTMPGCAPCVRDKKDYQPPLEKSGWKMGEDKYCHIKFIDASKNNFEYNEYDVKLVPQYMLMVKGEPVERHWRYPGWERMAKAYNDEVDRLNRQK